MESRNSSKLQITLLRYDIHIVAELFVLQYIPDYLALTVMNNNPIQVTPYPQKLSTCTHVPHFI